MRPQIHLTILATIACFVAVNNCSYAEERLHILTCECPPLSYEINGIPTGPAVDIARKIQKKINTNETIDIHPWARAYIMLLEQNNTVLFSTSRTPQRENMFKWVGPIAEKEFSFHAKTGEKIKINNLEDAKKYRIGVTIGSNNEQFLISNGFNNIHSVTVEKDNFGKLLLGRIDLWYTDTAQSSQLIEYFSRQGLVEEIYTVKTSKSYYAFNKNIPSSIVKKWQDALDDLKKDGTILEILKKYKLESLYPDDQGMK